MGRMRKAEPVVDTGNSLVASAARVNTSTFAGINRYNTGTEWHSTSWHYYHTIGEFRYGCDWQGAMLSKAILRASKKDPSTGNYDILYQGPAAEYMEDLFGDDDGRAEMLRLIGIHMAVTGKCFAVTYPDFEEFGGDEDIWRIVASTKLTRPTSPTDYYRIEGEVIPLNPNKVVCIEIWRPDPEDSRKPIAPSQAVLTSLGQIEALDQHIAAQVDSRLAGAGIMLFPSEMTFPTPPTPDGAVQRTANTADDLMAIIQTAMAAALRNRADPASKVPIVITAPSEAISAIHHIKFWSDLDEKVIEMRNAAVGRLALGMDIPPEVLKGNGDVNHWAAWQSDESAIKSHTEPLLKIITAALAKAYLRPALKGEVPDEDLRYYSIKADTSEMRLRPNRSKEAMELYDRGELTGKALLRETGFDDDDAPTDEDIRAWYLKKVASGQTTPELVAAALKELGLDLPVAPAVEVGQEARPTPSLGDHPTRDIPDREVSESRRDARDRGNVPSADPARRAAPTEEASRMAAAVAVASEQAVFRALERAGNRMRNKMGGKLPGISAGETYLTFGSSASDLDYFLEDAWGDNVTALAAHCGYSKEQLKDALDGYCRVLLTSQKPHSFKGLENHLTMALRMERTSL
jgi:hypothetical protein